MEGRLRIVIRRRVAMHLPFLVLALGSVFLLYSALLRGVIFETHETLHLYLRVQQYMGEFTNGFLQPQLFTDAMRGAGYAFPLFYPPVGYYTGALIGITTGSPAVGTNLSFFLSVLLSAMTCYACAAAIAGRPTVALLATIVYVTAPYRFTDVFVRGALGESWTFAWYPLAVLGGFRLLEMRGGGWLLSVGLAGAILSHSVMAMYFVMVLGAVLVVALLVMRTRKPVTHLLTCGVLGLGLAAWHVVPQLYYLDEVWASDPGRMLSSAAGMWRHRVHFGQLIRPDASRWFGLSKAGLEDGMSFALGFGNLLAVALLAAIACGTPTRLSRLNSASRKGLLAGCVMAWLLCLLFVLFPWPFAAVLPEAFTFIQFPWRVLGLLPVLSLVLVSVSWRALPPSRSWQAACVALSALLVVGVPTYQREPRLASDLKLERTDRERARQLGDTGYTPLAEYLPRSYTWPVAAMRFLTAPESDGAQVFGWRQVAYGVWLLDVDGSAPARIRVPLTAYPVWAATDDAGRRVVLSEEGGYLRLQTREGTRSVTLGRFYPMPYVAGWTVSAASAAILLWFSCRDVGARRSGRREKRSPQATRQPTPANPA